MPPNPTRRVARALLAPARHMHARIQARLDAPDAAARARGWTVQTRPHGGRTYRDPRFDQRATAAAAEQVAAGRGTG